MLFSSEIFLFLFLPFFLLIYHLSSIILQKIDSNYTRWLNAILFIASLVFYAWGEGLGVLILLSSAGLNFLAGLLIENRHRKLGLYLSLVGSLLLLFYFKYSHFFFNVIGIHTSAITLPIGISFYTFQGISYTLDIYWGKIRSNKNFIDFGTYLAMFPHQIAGPIVRYADIAPELAERRVTIESFGIGVERFIIGLAKKMLIANTFARIADAIFTESITNISPAVAWLGAVAYMFQIYFDFSGYSDMAIGLGRMVGFNFKENFNYPYTARSIQDFWRRWHISLSGWFRDYLYIPLGGNKQGLHRTYLNLILVFLVTGLWHGASWNFIVWGLYHGLFLLIERAGLSKRLSQVPALIAQIYTWFIILIGWVFFRSTDLTMAFIYLKKMAGFGITSRIVAYPISYFSTFEIGITFIIAIIFASQNYLRVQLSLSQINSKVLPFLSSILLFGLFILSVMYMTAGTYNPFIYFRF